MTRVTTVIAIPMASHAAVQACGPAVEPECWNSGTAIALSKVQDVAPAMLFCGGLKVEGKGILGCSRNGLHMLRTLYPLWGTNNVAFTPSACSLLTAGPHDLHFTQCQIGVLGHRNTNKSASFATTLNSFGFPLPNAMFPATRWVAMGMAMVANAHNKPIQPVPTTIPSVPHLHS